MHPEVSAARKLQPESQRGCSVAYLAEVPSRVMLERHAAGGILDRSVVLRVNRGFS